MWKPIKDFDYENAKVDDRFLFADIYTQEDETGNPVSFTILQVKVTEVTENPWTRKTYPTLFMDLAGNTLSVKDIISLEAYCTPKDFCEDITLKREKHIGLSENVLKAISTPIPFETPEAVPTPVYFEDKIETVSTKIDSSQNIDEGILTAEGVAERPKTRVKGGISHA